MDVDVELCGTDQIFNALAGRTLQKKLNRKEKFVVAVTLMENPKTGELMSKSKGTGVFLDTSANEMFGQVMAQPDEMIEILLTHCTSLSMDEVKKIISLPNPRDAKVRLAQEIVKLYHGETEADKAVQYFIETFSKGHVPEEVREVKGHEGMALLDFLVAAELATSKGEARRKIEQGGVSCEDEKLMDPNFILSAGNQGKILKVGKKDFVKIVF